MTDTQHTNDPPGPAAAKPNGNQGQSRSETTYPFHSLKEAVKLAKAVDDAGGNEASVEGVVKALGLVSKTGRGWTYRLSSAKEFGLVARQGRKDDARIALTDLARRILRPSSDDEREAALVRAFMSPRIYPDLVTKYDGAAPRVEQVKNALEREPFKVLGSVSEDAAEAFIESARFIGAIGSDGRLRAPGSDPLPLPAATPLPAGGQPTGAQERPPSEGGAIEVPAGWIVHSHVLRKGGVVVKLALPDDLNAKEVERLHRWLKTIPLDVDDEAAPV